MDLDPSQAEMDVLGKRYGVPAWALEDILARRRAGARDGELINLLRQAERGGLSQERANALIAELPV